MSYQRLSFDVIVCNLLFIEQVLNLDHYFKDAGAMWKKGDKSNFEMPFIQTFK